MNKDTPAPSFPPSLVGHALQGFDGGYQTVFERNPTPMWVIDLDTHRFLAVNSAAVSEYGYPPEKFLTLTIRDVYGEPDLGRFDAGVASDAQELYSGLWAHRRNDGTALQVEILSNDLVFKNHRARLIHATNVTAKLQAEAARRESEQLLAAIVESSGDAILSEAPDGTILTWNAGAERMFGYTVNEAIGASIYLLVPPEGHKELADSLAAVCSGVRLAPYETTRLRKGGQRLFVSIAISPIVNRAGAVVGISSIARDVTLQKTMEEQLRQTQKMEALGSLAGGIAHDFNNLLTIIIGNAELAIEELNPTSVAHADVEGIRLAAHNATLLTHQLLAFSRKGIAQDAPVDLNDTVTRLDTILRRTLDESVTFIVRQEPKLWRVKADPGQMEQVLMNLVLNARDAMPDGGTLTVDTDNVQVDEALAGPQAGVMPGPFVRLSVTDTGCGMTPDVRDHIFEPFFTTKGPTKGTGLGLSTVFGIVQHAAGFTHVESEPETGSTFSVYLPQIANEEAPLAKTAAAPVGTGTETILLVEDDNHIRALGARGLRRHGYTLLLARHAAEAVKLSERHSGKIDLLLTDIVMPGVNGRALAERLMKSRSELRVLYTSGYTDSIATLDAIRTSSAHFIQKPYSPDSLARKVRSVLDRVGRLS